MKYYSVTKYIDTFHPGYSAGTWVVDKEHSGTEDNPIHLPYVDLDQKVMDFMEDFYKSGISVNNYKEVLESAGIAEGLFDFVNLHILSQEVVCAMLTYIIRADRFCEGYLMAGIEHGTVARILKRLKEIDENNPYPDFHVKFVKGQRIADVKTVMLRDMGFPYDLPDRDAEYKTLDQKLISQLEDEFMYLIEELLPRNLQDLFYKVGLEPCHAYWQIYEGAVMVLRANTKEDEVYKIEVDAETQKSIITSMSNALDELIAEKTQIIFDGSYKPNEDEILKIENYQLSDEIKDAIRYNGSVVKTKIRDFYNELIWWISYKEHGENSGSLPRFNIC